MKLRIGWDDGNLVFTPADLITVGRTDECAVTVADTVVSRAHLSIMFVDGRWTFEDTSSNGTYIGGDRVTVGAIGGPIEVRLGSPTGPALIVEPLIEQPSALAPEAALAPPPVPAIGADTIRLDDRSLRLELDGVMHTFTPGHVAVVGRDENCQVRSTSSLVSGRHCSFTHVAEGWVIEDLGSTRGTWIDGRQVKRQMVEGAFFVHLGDDDAGEPLRVITAGVHRAPRDRRPLLIAAASLVLVLLAGIAALAFWPSDDGDRQLIVELQQELEAQRRQTDEQLRAAQERADAAIRELNERGGAGNSPAELSVARLATAFISVPDGNGVVVSTGSGALVSEDGLVLTNIHVVLPGLEFERTGDFAFQGLEDPETLLLSFPSEDGGPADLEFIAEQHSAHPAHDAALIRIVEGLNGATLDDLPEPLRAGNSSLLLAGDEVAVVGYPGTAFTDRVSVALSNFQSFQPCVDNGNEFDLAWGCLRDYDEGYLNLAGETLEGGSSGGPIVRNGDIVGIQLGVFGEQGASSGQNLGVPIDLIAEDLDIPSDQ